MFHSLLLFFCCIQSLYGLKVKNQCNSGDAITNLTFTNLSPEKINFHTNCSAILPPTCMANCTWQRSCRRSRDWARTQGRHTIVAGLRFDTQGREFAKVYCCQSNTTLLGACYIRPARINKVIELSPTEVFRDVIAAKRRISSKIKIEVCSIVAVPVGECELKQREDEKTEKKESKNQDKNDRNRTPKNNTGSGNSILDLAVGLPLGLGLGIGVPLAALDNYDYDYDYYYDDDCDDYDPYYNDCVY